MFTTVDSNGGDLTSDVAAADSIIFTFAALAFLVASFRPTEAGMKVAFFIFFFFFDDEGSSMGGPDLNKFRYAGAKGNPEVEAIFLHLLDACQDVESEEVLDVIVSGYKVMKLLDSC